MAQQARYSFLSWLRQGFATQLQTPDRLGGGDEPDDAGSSVRLRLQAVGDGQDLPDGSFEQTIQLYGPGEVLGIASHAIIKTQPRRNGHDFEPNYLPYIEFYEEDFPWRYTPFAAQQDRRLRPWLTLVVLEASEFTQDEIVQGDRLPSFTITGSPEAPPFPPAAQVWAWAHVHVNESLGLTGNHPTGDEAAEAVAELYNILQRNPNMACSRILCPRRLKPLTEYFAFLIPTFERGRLAGLGRSAAEIQAAAAQAVAWGQGQDRFPYYYDWRFRTGEPEDFESLVLKIKGRQLDPRVGKRWIDLQDPGYLLHYTDPAPGTDAEEGDTDTPQMLVDGAILMEGALRIPQTDLPNLLDVPAADKDEAFIEQLQALLNLEEDMRQGKVLDAGHTYFQNPYFPEPTGDDPPVRPPVYDDPLILPPIYGRWHAAISRIDRSGQEDNTWYNQLNLDPRHRITAGFGAEAIRRGQEEYMDRAWGQFDGLFAGNEYLRKMQFVQAINQAVYTKHFLGMRSDQVAAISGGVQQVVRHDQQTSLRGLIHQRAIPDALVSPAAEKIANPNRVMMRRIAKGSQGGGAGMTGFTVQPPPNMVQMNLLSGGTDLTQLAVPALSQTSGQLVFQAVSISDSLKSRIDKALTNRGRFLRISGIADADTGRFFTALQKFKDRGYLKVPVGQGVANRPPLNFTEVSTTVLQAIQPKAALTRKIRSQWQFDDPQDAAAIDQEIQPLVKAPTFPDAMCDALTAINAEHLVPNLDLIPPNTASIMETNQAFIEAYLVGLNHEMARELLWREYPTDQRGSYFRHFWGIRDRRIPTGPDIDPVHRWRQALGDNEAGANDPNPPAPQPERLVLVLRADLLRRFPNVIIYLQKAKKQDGQLKLGTAVEEPIFFAQIEPDIFFVGFDISVADARKGNGYFAVLRERPGELRFGLDLDPPDADNGETLSWDQLYWGDLPEVDRYIDLTKDIPPQAVREGIAWGLGNGGQAGDPASGDGQAANMAWILQQKPMKVAIHLDMMLPKQSD